MYRLFQASPFNGETLEQTNPTECCVEMDRSLEFPNESMNATVSLSLQSASKETVSCLASPSMSHHLYHVCLCFKVPSTNSTTNIQQKRVLKRNKQKKVASKMYKKMYIIQKCIIIQLIKRTCLSVFLFSII